MEFTSGRANITLPFDIAPHDGNIIDAMWQFSPDPPCVSVNAGQTGQGKAKKRNVCGATQTYRSTFRSRGYYSTYSLRSVQKTLQRISACVKACQKHITSPIGN